MILCCAMIVCYAMIVCSCWRRTILVAITLLFCLHFRLCIMQFILEICVEVSHRQFIFLKGYVSKKIITWLASFYWISKAQLKVLDYNLSFVGVMMPVYRTSQHGSSNQSGCFIRPTSKSKSYVLDLVLNQTYILVLVWVRFVFCSGQTIFGRVEPLELWQIQTVNSSCQNISHTWTF